jgi:hypothetical protein
MDYVTEVVERVARRACDLPGMRIVSQPRRLRHFTARFEPNELTTSGGGQHRCPPANSSVAGRGPGLADRAATAPSQAAPA